MGDVTFILLGFWLLAWWGTTLSQEKWNTMGSFYKTITHKVIKFWVFTCVSICKHFRFKDIQKESKIDFYKDVGYMAVSGNNYREFKVMEWKLFWFQFNSSYDQDWMAASRIIQEEGKGVILNSEEVTQCLPFMKLSSDQSVACYQPPGMSS